MVANENKQYLKNIEDFVNKNPDTVRSLFIDRIIGFGDILDLYSNYSDVEFGSKMQVICFLQYLHEPKDCTYCNNGWRYDFGIHMNDNEFCSGGERKDKTDLKEIK